MPSGKLTPLPKPSIDTGMGLERVAAVLQGVISNYETDLFTPLIKRAAELTATTTGHVGTAASAVQAEQSSAGSLSHKSTASLRVIADHSRAATFLISDGVLPSNEGRGYVLRKIIRRAITHGRLLGQTKPFLHEMVFPVRDLMRDAYPELNESAERVAKVVLAEETRFSHTLESGLGELQDLINELGMDRVAAFARKKSLAPSSLNPGPAYGLLPTTPVREAKVVAETIFRPDLAAEFLAEPYIYQLPGKDVFKLYDTFGMPLDFMQDAARDQRIEFDQAGFDRAMKEQRERARASWKGAAKQTANPAYQQLPKSEFEGYRQTRSDGCEVLAIIHNGQGVQELKAGESGEVILDHTPFYAEAGGQVGDRGWFYSDDHNTVVAEVTGCYYPVQGVRRASGYRQNPTRFEGSGIRLTPSSTPTFGRRLCGIIRLRICCMLGCGKFWGSM